MTPEDEMAISAYLLSSRANIQNFVDDKLDELKRKFKTLFDNVAEDVDSLYEGSVNYENSKKVKEITELLQQLNIINKGHLTFKRLERTKL